MTYDEKVAWLRRYRQALRDEARLRDRIKAVRSRAESTTQALRPVVGGDSQDGTKIERGAELLDQYQQELQEQLKASEQIRVEIEAAISMACLSGVLQTGSTSLKGGSWATRRELSKIFKLCTSVHLLRW